MNDHLDPPAIHPRRVCAALACATALLSSTFVLRAQGTLDTTFNTTGRVQTTINANGDKATGVAVQSDGKIVVAGTATVSGGSDIYVARYDTSGVLDTTFNSTGIVTTSINASDYATGVAIQSDGKIVVCGYSYSISKANFAIVRFNSNGTLDTTFNSTGKVVTPIHATNSDLCQAIGIQSDGKIVVVGYTNTSNPLFCAVRYTTAGAQDTTFGASNGIAIVPAIGSNGDQAYGMTIQSDGNIVIVGGTVNGTNFDWALARLTTTGALDTTFNGTGKLITANTGSAELAYGVEQQTDGKLVVTGYASNGSNDDIVTIRYSTTGAFDTVFPTTTFSGTSHERGQAVALQSDGKILVAGFTNSPGTYDFALVRYNTTGTLDTTFNTTGKVTTAFGTSTDEAAAMRLQSDGKIIVAGLYNDASFVEHTAVARYTAVAPLADISVEQPAGTALTDGTSTVAYGSTNVGGALTRTFTIVNTGNTNLSSLAVTKDGTNSAEFTVGSLSAPTVPPAGTATFDVTFAPSAAGAKTAAIHIASNVTGGKNPFDINLSGTGLSLPEIAVEQPASTDLTDGSSTVDYGSISTGMPSVKTFTIKNIGTGGSQLTGLAITKDGADAADFAVSSLSTTTLAGGTSTTFTVTFTPSSLGAKAAAIHIASNDADENPFDISLTGSGAPAFSEISVEHPPGTDLTDGSSTANFGTVLVNSPVVKTFTIRNTGTIDLTLSGVTKDGTDAAEFAVSALSAGTVAPGAAATFTVTFNAASPGAKAAAIHIGSNDTDEGSFDIGLAGTGTASAPEIVVEQPAANNLTDESSSVSFGGTTAGVPVVKTFTIRNTGNLNLTGIAITKDGENATDFTVGAPGAVTLATGASTTFDVTFNPTGTGFKSAAIHIASNDSDENPFDIQLVGSVSLVVTYKDGANDPFTGTAYAGTEDLWLFNNGGAATDQNTGADGRVIAGGTGGTSYRHELMRFNLSSLAGQFGSINSATLRLYWNGANSNSGTMQVYPVSSANAGWVEGNSGTGSTAPNGVSTWGHRVRTTQLWAGSAGASTAGTDYDNTLLASTAYASAPTGQAFDLVFTSTAVISNWLTPGNAGLFIRTAAQDNQAIFHSSESTASMHPELIIGYTPAVPEIIVEQPTGTSLVDGSATISLGNAAVGASATKFFVIRNVGAASLTGLGITVDGADAAMFSVSAYPIVPVAASGGSTTFTVRFAPTSLGSKSAALHISSNDANENTFDIALTGTGATPEIALHDGATTGAAQITDGQSTVIDFGYTAQGTPISRSFTIANTGSANLTVSSITAPSGFTVLNAPASPVAALSTHTFQVRLDGASTGTFSGSVVVNSDDTDEAVFDFPISGIVQNAPFQNWAASNGLTGGNLAPTANPAGDGVENLVKYAFNMNPAAVDIGVLASGTGTTGLPAYDRTGSGASSFFRYEFIRRIGSGLIYTPKKSPDLLNWSNLTSTPAITPIDASWERVVHLEPFDGTTVVELFGMVEVTLP